MRSRHSFVLAAVVAAGCTAGGMAGRGQPPGEEADLVVLDAKVLTVDDAFTQAEAVAVRNGVFVAVGPSRDVGGWIGPKTRVIDAHGHTVVPGLIESHVHSLGASKEELEEPFEQLSSVAEIQGWLRRKSQHTEAGRWIRLQRIDVTRLKEHRFPTRLELDQGAPRNPVVFSWQFSGVQIQVLNSAALEAAHITHESEAPRGAVIEKSASGEPTGLLRNMSGTISPFFAKSAPLSEEQRLAGLEALLHRYNEVGITTIFERLAGVSGLETFMKLRAQGRLPLRVTGTIGFGSDGTVEGTEKAIGRLPFKPGEGDDWVRVGPLKLGVDGGVLYGTAYMRQPYEDGATALFGKREAASRGHLDITADKIKTIIRTGHRVGWQMASHATGDGSVDAVLDAVEAANADSPITQRRYTLIHAYFANPDQVQRAAQLGVCVDTQPAWYYKDGDALLGALGPDRMRQFIGLGTWRRAGVKVAINSDHMEGANPNKSLNPFNPFLTMYIAISRKTENGNVYGPEQRVSRPDALRMMTADAAYLGFEEIRKGSIQVGKLGDLAILSDDFLTCPEDRIKDIRVLTTVVGGRVMFQQPL